jgi:excisionase family DNA binding protein
MPLEFGDMTLYTVDDLAEMLSVSVTTVRSYIRSGVLKGRKMGRRWYVPDESVQQYFREMEAQGRIDVPGGTLPVIATQPEVEEIMMEDDDETIPVEEVPASPPLPSLPPVLQVAPASTSTNEWSDDMRELLQQAERLKREARRVEQLYADQDRKTSTQSGASGG